MALNDVTYIYTYIYTDSIHEVVEVRMQSFWEISNSSSNYVLKC